MSQELHNHHLQILEDLGVLNAKTDYSDADKFIKLDRKEVIEKVTNAVGEHWKKNPEFVASITSSSLNDRDKTIKDALMKQFSLSSEETKDLSVDQIIALGVASMGKTMDAGQAKALEEARNAKAELERLRKEEIPKLLAEKDEKYNRQIIRQQLTEHISSLKLTNTPKVIVPALLERFAEKGYTIGITGDSQQLSIKGKLNADILIEGTINPKPLETIIKEAVAEIGFLKVNEADGGDGKTGSESGGGIVITPTGNGGVKDESSKVQNQSSGMRKALARVEELKAHSAKS